ncbi:helix-turn-helix transcriptional regulator [Chryseobacterium sp. CKR4-1]|uniref:helix-turn-helix domain-containing protein n=1 Tax=Chryseobacterium sp. CKR4-1 TaxID=3068896 RepID=UPI0027965F5B|nr:helix-turn-helix transcriptional regulator [Chryseobacterium sp. CKR4-1]MDQ1803091.1 helix-turn-helix transcriptional regulator [Chryseobacterium sp. CKR4-1]
MATLGTKLTRLRQRKGYSQQEVADLLHISQPAYHKWETDTSKPGLESVVKLCEIYDIEINDLLEDGNTVISNNTFDSCSSNVIGAAYNPVFNINSSAMMEGIIKNQEHLAKLMDSQNKLIEALIEKLRA